MYDPSRQTTESRVHAAPIDLEEARARIQLVRPKLSQLNWTHAVIGVPLAGVALVLVIFAVLITHGGSGTPTVSGAAQPFVTAGATSPH